MRFVGVELKPYEVVPIINLNVQNPQHRKPKNARNLGLRIVAHAFQIKGEEFLPVLPETTKVNVTSSVS
jgi:hypothetical protein